MRVLIIIGISLLFGLIVLYLIGGRRDDIYGYGFWDFVKDSFKGTLKEKLFSLVISIIVGLVAFFVLSILLRQCNFDDDADEFDEERGFRLHTELLMEYNHGTEITEDTLYCSGLFDYWAV